MIAGGIMRSGNVDDAGVLDGAGVCLGARDAGVVWLEAVSVALVRDECACSMQGANVAWSTVRDERRCEKKREGGPGGGDSEERG